MITLLTKEQAVVHFLSLSPEDRYTRFCMAASDEYIRSYVEHASGFFYGEVQVIPSNTVNIGISLPSLVTIAVGVIHVNFDINTQSMEVAVSVLPEYKGRNLGKKLMYFAQGMAEVHQAKKLVISGLSQNSPMIQLAKACGYSVNSQYGEFEGSLSTIGADIKTIADNNIKLFNILLGKENVYSG